MSADHRTDLIAPMTSEHSAPTAEAHQGESSRSVANPDRVRVSRPTDVAWAPAPTHA